MSARFTPPPKVWLRDVGVGGMGDVAPCGAPLGDRLWDAP